MHICKEVRGPVVWNACTDGDHSEDSSMASRAFFKVCLVLIFLNTIVEKTYPEPWNYSFVSISCSESPAWSSQNLQYKFLDWKWHHPPPPRNFPKNSSDLVAWPVPKYLYNKFFFLLGVGKADEICHYQHSYYGNVQQQLLVTARVA